MTISTNAQDKHITEITNDNFKSFFEIHRNETILIDFYTTWCGPCKQMTPVLETFAASKTREDLIIAKIDIEKLDLASAPHDIIDIAKLNIRSVPTFVLFREGEVLETHAGSLTLKDLQQFVDKSISTHPHHPAPTVKPREDHDKSQA